MRKFLNGSKTLFILGIILLLSQSNILYADGFEKDTQIISVTNKFGNIVNFDINKDLLNSINSDELENIANDHPDVENIRIHNIIEAENNDLKMSPRFIVNPRPKNITKKYTDRNVSLGSKFITSVARGSSKTIEQTFSATSSVSGSLSLVDLSLEAGVSYTISRTFTGPDRDSRNNTTKYYIKWEGDKGTYSAEVFSPSQIENNGWSRVNGKFTEVRRGIEYSYDTRA